MPDSRPEGVVFAEHTRCELSASAADSTVVIPLGSTEQHGRHLPVGVDTAIVTAIAHRAADEARQQGASTLVTPTLPFGFAEHHVVFGGTVSIDVRTYVDLLFAIGASLCRQGFHRLVFLNGHGGNDAPARVAVERLAFELGERVAVAAASYWDIAGETLAEIDLPPGLVPGHAGHFETSLMLVLAPELVRLESRMRDDIAATPIGTPEPFRATVRRPGQWERSDGRTDDASRASVALGERVLAAVVQDVARFLVQFHQSTT